MSPGLRSGLSSSQLHGWKCHTPSFCPSLPALPPAVSHMQQPQPKGLPVLLSSPLLGHHTRQLPAQRSIHAWDSRQLHGGSRGPKTSAGAQLPNARRHRRAELHGHHRHLRWHLSAAAAALRRSHQAALFGCQWWIQPGGKPGGVIPRHPDSVGGGRIQYRLRKRRVWRPQWEDCLYQNTKCSLMPPQVLPPPTSLLFKSIHPYLSDDSGLLVSVLSVSSSFLDFSLSSDSHPFPAVGTGLPLLWEAWWEAAVS